MKLLVGLLVTIENEYNECISSIKLQENVDQDIYEIKNRPKNSAHDELYKHFMTNCDQYDLLIKVDADMIIADRYLFQKIVKEFEENNSLDRLFIPTFDHFVGRNLGGVNVYRNTVKWHRNKDNYYTDRVHAEDSIREFKKWETSEKDPAIHHCPDPSDFQAFHFGLHRAIKAFQFGAKSRRHQSGHWLTFKEILNNYHHTKNRKLLLAIAAAIYVYDNKLDGSYINYNNELTKDIFERINQMNLTQLERYAVQNWKIKLLTLFGKYSYYTLLTSSRVFK